MIARSLAISPAVSNTAVGYMRSLPTTETLPSLRDPTTVRLERLRSLTIPLAITTASLGTSALEFNTTGEENTATGYRSLRSNTTGSFNTASGFQALNSATPLVSQQHGHRMQSALVNNTTGSFNTATGAAALGDNTTGIRNTANGVDALGDNILPATIRPSAWGATTLPLPASWRSAL